VIENLNYVDKFTPIISARLYNIVRLVGSPLPREGRLEVYSNDAWGTVSYLQFDHAAASVACHMLGFG